MSILLLLSLLLPSCSLETSIPVTLTIAEEHPFEALYGEDLWYELSYFDGTGIRTIHAGKGLRDITVSVTSGGLRAFVMKPLGELGPIGGFFEPGGSRHVSLTSENGEMADLLLSAFSYRPDAVSRLSMEKVRKENPDLSSIDQANFLSDLFDGTLDPKALSLYEEGHIAFDSIPEGTWVSERYEVPSFSVGMSGEEVPFDIYPGVYRYIEKERALLLTVIYTEEGEASATIRKAPI